MKKVPSFKLIVRWCMIAVPTYFILIPLQFAYHYYRAGSTPDLSTLQGFELAAGSLEAVSIGIGIIAILINLTIRLWHWTYSR